MEKICDALKTFLIADLPEYLAEATTAEVPLAAFTEKTITLGGVDLQKHTSDVEAFIVPDRQDTEELSLASNESKTPLELLIVVRRADPEVLFRRALRFAAAVKKALQRDPSMSGAVVSATVPAVEYFQEVEALTGVKAISLTIEVTTEELEE